MFQVHELLLHTGKIGSILCEGTLNFPTRQAAQKAADKYYRKSRRHGRRPLLSIVEVGNMPADHQLTDG